MLFQLYNNEQIVTSNDIVIGCDKTMRTLSDKIIWGTLLIIDLFILYLFRQSIWLGLAWFCALLLLEVLPFYALESCVTFRHVKMFVTHYLADYIGESEEIYEM